MISKNFSNPNHVSSHADDFQEQLQITSLALESVSDGVLITDANGIITSANNSFYSITAKTLAKFPYFFVSQALA